MLSPSPKIKQWMCQRTLSLFPASSKGYLVIISVYERGIKLSLSFVRELKDEENYMKSGCRLLAVLLNFGVSIAEE